MSSGGALYSLDNYLDRVPPDEDIFSTMEYRRASEKLKVDVEQEINTYKRDLVVDTIGARLFEIRDLWNLGVNAGFDVSVHTPTTAWARDPEECESRTKFKLRESTWRFLINIWEGPATETQIKSALAPEERINQIRWVAAINDVTRNPEEVKEREKFLMRNFTMKEIGDLARSGYLGDKRLSRLKREAFRLEMEAQGKKPPCLEQIYEPELAIASASDLEKKLQDKLSKTGPETPDI